MTVEKIDSNSKPQEFAPFHLLSSRERQLLQHIADGLPNSEIVEAMDEFSINSVENLRHKMRNVGTSIRGTNGTREEKVRVVVLALIQQGINNGYIKHDIGGQELIPLSRTEDETLYFISQGMTYSETASNRKVSIKTTEAQMLRIFQKLRTRNYYHAVARRAYLMLNGQWQVSNLRGAKSNIEKGK